MASIEDILTIAEDIRQYVIDLPTRLLVRAGQIVIYSGLSDISESLGMVQAGEFRAGNRNNPGTFLKTAVAGSGFSGMRMLYPPVMYDLGGSDEYWNLVGIEDDVLQFGVRASDGKLVAGGGAVILDDSGITATGGTIAGWVINTDHLLSDGTPGIKILSTGAIETSDFVAGLYGKGWRISEAGSAEFANAYIRGELRATVFSYSEIQATSGTLGVFKSAQPLWADLTLPVTPTGVYWIYLKNPALGEVQLLADEDILRIKNGTGDTWFKYDSATGANAHTSSYWAYQVEYVSGSKDITYTVGQAVINYGSSGQGWIELTADDDNAPFISIKTHAGTPSTPTEHLRMGNLNGWGAYSTDIYGVAIGVYDTNLPNITVDPTNGLRIRTHSTTVIQFEADGDAFIAGDLVMGAAGRFLAGDAAPVTGEYTFEINNEGIKILAIPVASWPDYTSGNVIYWESDSLTPAKVFSITSYIDGSSVRFSRIEATNSRLFIRAEYPEVYGSNIYMYGDENGMVITTKASPIVIDANGGTLGTIDLDGEVSITITAPTVNVVGLLQLTGNLRITEDIQVAGVYASYKNSTAYIGYIFVPLTTPLTSTSWDGDAKTTADNATIDLSAVFDAPAGIKAVSVHFATTSATVSRISALGNVTTFNMLKMVGQVANVENSISGVLPCDSNGDINFYCSGDLAAVYIKILGYFI